VLELYYCNISIDAIAAMSIDLGTEFMKTAIVMHRRAMEVVLDGESKRKTPTAIAFLANGERLFGRAAVSMATRTPEFVFQNIPSLIGKTLDHPTIRLFRQRYPYHNMTYDDTNGQVVFSHPNGMTFTVEELVAMLFEYARNIAESHAGTVLRTVVLTVPSFYSQAERRSLVRAAELAGLEVIQLLNDNSAVALNFGVFRHNMFNQTAQYFLFYDVGFTSTVATVVCKFDLNVVFALCAPTLGTSTFIYRLRDHLAGQFKAQKPSVKGDITQNPRAMSKLTQEAARIFVMLSANLEAHSQIESLFEGEDFHIKVTRTDLESIGADAFELLRQPFRDALKSSNVELSALQDIVIMGGGTRVPKVQSILVEMGKRSDLGKGVNGDEAAVLGAVYMAAARTPGFRVVRFGLRDYNPYPLAVDFERAPVGPTKAWNTAETSDNSSSYVRRILFPRGNPYPQKRAITFNRHVDDFTFFVNYLDLSEQESAFLGVTNISRVLTKGVASVVERHPEAEMRGVKAHFTLDPSGLLVLTGIDCILHPLPEVPSEPQDQSTLQKLGNTISEFFGVVSGSSNPEPPVDKNESDSESGAAAGSSPASNETEPAKVNQNVTGTANASSATDLNKTKEIVKKPVPFTERISFHLDHLDSSSPTDDRKIAARAKLRALAQVDQDKRDLENAINELESTLFATRDKLQSEIFVMHSTEIELNALSELLTEYSDWYEEQGPTTIKEAYEERFSKIREHLIPIEFRVSEATNRPRALRELNESIDEAETFLRIMSDTMSHLKLSETATLGNRTEAVSESATSENGTLSESPKPPVTPPWPLLFTDSEQKSLIDLVDSMKVRLDETNVKLNASSPIERPPVLVSEIEEWSRKLKREVRYLNKKLTIWRSEMERLLKLQVEQTMQPPPSSPMSPDTQEDESKPVETTASSDAPEPIDLPSKAEKSAAAGKR
ncbi:hypoxia up-regulated 1, partial [Paragonimus westermani]